MRGYTDGTFARLRCARVMMRSESECRRERQHQTQQRNGLQNRTHVCDLEKLLIEPTPDWESNAKDLGGPL